MPEAFDRDFAITVGPRLIRARQEPTFTQDQFGNEVQEATQSRDTLRVVFEVQKGNTKNPNSAKVEIYNLSRDSRQAIAATERPLVIIEAGYTGNIQQLFRGNLVFAQSERRGTDFITRVESGDGQQQLATARVNESFAPGTQITQVVEALSAAIDIDPGNLISRFQEGGLRKGITEFVSGRVISGRVIDELRKITDSAGLELSIQDGRFQVLDPDRDTGETAFLVTPRSGLIGSPDTGDQGSVEFTTLLLPGLLPGRRVRLESAEIEGDYRVEKVTHSGDTWGTEYYSRVEGKVIE